MTDDDPTSEPTGVPLTSIKTTSLGQRILELSLAIAAIAVLVALLLPSVSRGRAGALRSQCKNNLKQIGLGLYNYHEAFDSLPPAYMADSEGRPMHSWRVLLLPQISDAFLYSQYRFDEPWNGPSNRLLGEVGLSIFSCPSDKHSHAANGRSPETSYVAVVGNGTAWRGTRPTSLRDFKDGTSNTLLVVEVANSGIHWMEPRDLHVSQMATKINAKSGQGISSRHEGVAYALMADGSVRFLSDTMSEAVLRSLLTINGGEEIPEF